MSVRDLVERLENKPIRELLTELYLDKDMTISEIAKRLGVSVGIVHKWLKEEGINKQKNIFETEEHFG